MMPKRKTDHTPEQREAAEMICELLRQKWSKLDNTRQKTFLNSYRRNATSDGVMWAIACIKDEYELK